MAQIILSGQSSGQNTKDATATAADILSGLTAYVASGKVTGTLKIKEASGTFDITGSLSPQPITITVGFKPSAVFVRRTPAGDTNFQNAILRYNDATMKCTNGGSYTALSAVEFTDTGFTAKAVATSSSGTDSWTWFAVGM